MNKKAKKKRVKYITTNLANQIKHEHKKVCATKKNKYFYRVNTDRKKKKTHSFNTQNFKSLYPSL